MLMSTLLRHTHIHTTDWLWVFCSLFWVLSLQLQISVPAELPENAAGDDAFLQQLHKILVDVSAVLRFVG